MSCKNPVHLPLESIKHAKLLETLQAQGAYIPGQRFFDVPCGKCLDCIVSHAKTWGVRCMCEYQSSSEAVKFRSWFITLTYNDENCSGELNKDHVRQFINSLRKHYRNKYKVKYFYCGEYGTKNLRPHYHLIVFDLPLYDLQYLKMNINGDFLYTSKWLENLWGRGFVTIGDVTLQSANYVARYSLKKNDTDCFMCCSPGFGLKYFWLHKDDILGNQCINVSTSKGEILKASIPRYFLRKYREQVGDDVYFKFMKHRNKKFRDYELIVNDKVKDRSWRDTMGAKFLGVSSTPVNLTQEAKRVIKQSLYEFYNRRDLD